MAPNDGSRLAIDFEDRFPQPVDDRQDGEQHDAEGDRRHRAVRGRVPGEQRHPQERRDDRRHASGNQCDGVDRPAERETTQLLPSTEHREHGQGEEGPHGPGHARDRIGQVRAALLGQFGRFGGAGRFAHVSGCPPSRSMEPKASRRARDAAQATSSTGPGSIRAPRRPSRSPVSTAARSPMT